MASTSSTSGVASISGLISGFDSATFINQILSIERQPETRMKTKISTLEAQKTAIQNLRTQLLSFRSAVQSFKLSNTFGQFEADSSETSVATATVSGTTPVVGSYLINVTQMASATVAQSGAKLGGTINPDAGMSSSGMTTEVDEGTFTVNGVTFTINDSTTESLNSVLTQINNSAAGVTATYDAATDTVTFENKTAGDTSLINFGGTDDTSNFLSAINVKKATQSTNASGTTTAKSTTNLGAVDSNKNLNTLNFASGTAITAGTFQVNGVSITVDPTTDSLNDVLERINSSDAQVNASYDSVTDKIRVVAKGLGSRTVAFTAGTSNFLTATALDTAVQTAGNDAKFSINGGETLTRNSNEVADALGGVTLRLLSKGETTVTISSDDDKIVEDVKAFVTSFNETVDAIATATGESGTLANDSTIREIESSIRSLVFGTVSGISGEYSSLIDLGITTGSTFDSKATAHLELDEDTLREALREDRNNVQAVFNTSSKNGIADQIFDYLDSLTKTTGSLYQRTKTNGSIDTQITTLNSQIDSLEERIAQHETRLKKQFNKLETLSASLKTDSAALSTLGSISL